MFEHWILQPGYPEYTQDDSGYSAVIKFVCPLEHVNASMPEHNSSFPVNFFSHLTHLEHTLLKAKHIKTSNNGQNAYITLTYKEPGRGSGSQPDRKDNSTNYYLSAGTIDKAIETHPSYKTLWNYNLCCKKGTMEAKPDISKAKTTNLGDKTEWKWCKEPSEMPQGWIIATSKTKPGTESYIYPAPVSHKKTYYSKQSSANNAAANVAKKRNPGNTFGKDGDWLVMGGNVYYEDGFWVSELDYQFADIVDNDIYAG